MAAYYVDMGELRDSIARKLKYEALIFAVVHFGGMIFLWVFAIALSMLLAFKLDISGLAVLIPFWAFLWFGNKKLSVLMRDTCSIFNRSLYKHEIATVAYILGAFVIPKTQKEHTGIRLQVDAAMEALEKGECGHAGVEMFRLMDKHPWLFEKAGPLE